MLSLLEALLVDSPDVDEPADVVDSLLEPVDVVDSLLEPIDIVDALLEPIDVVDPLLSPASVVVLEAADGQSQTPNASPSALHT